jgi:hypothetical protein
MPIRNYLRWGVATISALGIVAQFQVIAQSSGTTGSTACGTLKSQWRSVEITLAELQSGDVGDSSAPRATMRAVQAGNEYGQAQLIFDLMVDHKCPLPGSAPSPMTYYSDALRCDTARLKGSPSASECDYSSWGGEKSMVPAVPSRDQSRALQTSPPNTPSSVDRWLERTQTHPTN